MTRDSLDKVDEKLDGVADKVSGLKNLITRLEEKLERGVWLEDAKLVMDYPKIKNIQKQSYGKVMWGFSDFVIYQNHGAKTYLIYAFGDVSGFIQLKRDEQGRVHIVNFCILPEYQNKGVGTDVLKKVKKIAKDWGSDELTLYVRESNNKAISVYKKSGFTLGYTHTRLYSDTKEDGLFMISRV